MSDPSGGGRFGKNLLSRGKTVRVMVLGQEGVGKSALVVRFITKRFIGEYDRTLEKVYAFQTCMENESVSFEILDTAGRPQEDGCILRESDIKWAEVFLLMYSVTDKCSFEDCARLKFLINYSKRRRRLGSDSKDAAVEVPVVLIGNKTDLVRERMVSKEEGLAVSRDIGCVSFREISVRESVDEAREVFQEAFRSWKLHKKHSKPRRSRSESEKSGGSAITVAGKTRGERETDTASNTPSPSASISGVALTDAEEKRHKSDVFTQIRDLPPFRSRAQTDGILTLRCCPSGGLTRLTRQRRMSISARGKNSSC